MTDASSRSRPRVLISSAVIDLPEHRAAAIEACSRVGAEPLVLETLPGDASDAVDRCRSLLERADIYLGILGFRYGFVPPGEQKSLTEIEYEGAREKGIPRLMFLMSSDHPVRATDVETGPGADELRRFKAKARREAVVAEFRSAAELKAAVVTALVETMRHDSPGRDPQTVLLLLPLGAEYADLRRLLHRELESHYVRVLMLDDAISTGAMWANAIANEISSAELVIADVTASNPNVMYELGYAHALKKPTVILSESSALRGLPSDVAGLRVLTYEKQRLEALRHPLQRLLREYLREGRR